MTDHQSPQRVDLADLADAFAASQIKAELKGNSLIVELDDLKVHIDLSPPTTSGSDNGPIAAVVKIRTELSEEVGAALAESGMAVMLNRMATLGAITLENGKWLAASRLTIFEADNAWNVHFPLILFSALFGANSILGAMLHMDDPQTEEATSKWQEQDFLQVESHLSRICVCSTGGLGLTAEFGLQPGAGSAIGGDNNTALWKLDAEQSHPFVDGGLFCLLQMPQRVADEATLDHLIDELNRLELECEDLPPHFGAWCRGNLDDNPAYISFLPNALHSVSGIATNVSFWAMGRALWAHEVIDSMLETA